MPTTFNFLSSGPLYTAAWAELPEVDALLSTPPRLSTVLDWGAGGREVFATPGDAKSYPFVNPEFELIQAGTTGGGLPFEAYHRANDPGGWGLRWFVAGFVVETHIREIEGADTLAVVLNNVNFAAAPPGNLMATLSPPIGIGVSTRPGYQEYVVWATPNPRPQPLELLSVAITRPGALAVQDVRLALAGDASSARIGTDQGFDLAVAVARETPVVGDAWDPNTTITRDLPASDAALGIAQGFNLTPFAAVSIG